MLDNTLPQPYKFRTKNWVETNDDARGTYNEGNQIRLKLQCWSQVYVIIVIHVYFLKELQQLKTKHPRLNQ